MKFFEAVPSELFSPLASPNRILYADALDVLYAAYQENLKIREDVLYSMLRGRLEQELADATFEDEDIDEEELRDMLYLLVTRRDCLPGLWSCLKWGNRQRPNCRMLSAVRLIKQRIVLQS